MTVLDVRELRTTFQTREGAACAVDGVSFTLERGRVLGLVGESGSGKSVTSLSLMRLLPRGVRVEGQALLNGVDLVTAADAELRRLRGGEIAMIFQDPTTSLNPVYTVGWQLEEMIRLHNDIPRAQVRERARDMLGAVGIAQPATRLDDYPHQFSGGMRQRVMIAMALANNPSVLIADEPTTALDVTTQAQILVLLRRLRAEFDSAIMLITHDLGVVAEICDDVAVMYGGRIVERAPVDEIFESPRHPYTWGLLDSMPSRATSGRLRSIPGTPPSLTELPGGCRFHPRCPVAMDKCRTEPPALRPEGDDGGHLDACHLPAERKRAHGQGLASAPAVSR
ncbi:MAG: ABC transporter ATP-binding protein [Actinobacteria bacterium]|nr:ABC transporter ATP-binding protein [Actinomycetota bacterium]